MLGLDCKTASSESLRLSNSNDELLFLRSKVMRTLGICSFCIDSLMFLDVSMTIAQYATKQVTV